MTVSRTVFDQTVGTAFDNREEIRLYTTYIEFAGNPTGTVVPDFVGQECLDTVGNIFYKASTALASGWAALHA